MIRRPILGPNLGLMLSKLLTWDFWSKANPVPSAGGIEEHERSHLYQLHHASFKDLMTAVEKRCTARKGCQVKIKAESVWVDAKVYADFTLPGHSSLSTELADLLVDAHVSHSGRPAFRKAGLVQAKSTSGCTRFDGGCCTVGATDPTNKERDLFETHIGPILLHASGQGTSTKKPRKRTPIPASGNAFDVSGDPHANPAFKHQLIDYAVYLLFPKSQPTHGGYEPYQVLRPINRTVSAGTCRDYEDWLSDLADVNSSIPQVGHRPKWQELVNAVSAWATAQNLSKGTFSRVRQRVPYKVSSFLSIEAIAGGPMPGFQTLASTLQQYLRFGTHANPGGRLPPPVEGEEHRRGFWYIRMQVNYESKDVSN